jgi:hypothetical protein
METVRGIASMIAAGMLTPFAGHNVMWSLVPLSILISAGMLWVFRLTSNQESLRKVKGLLQAHLYEMRLFTDEPALIWKAQLGLLSANIRYIAMMLVPAIVMTVPMVLIFSQLECFYGYAPLQPGQQAIVTMQMKEGESGAIPAMKTPVGIELESPAVRVDGTRQISWRIRAVRATAGDLQFVFPGQTITKSIDAGIGPAYLSPRRVSSMLDLVLHPSESRLPASAVDWIELRYPTATVHALGMDLHWLIWLLVISMIGALLLKRQFKVTF